MMFGSDRSRFFYSKRGVEDKNCGPLIKTIMTRCIHCTRCVRFFQDVAGREDLGTTLRGQSTEIGTYIGKNLNSELSGNIIDLCPVGALTSKPYAFTARSWEIKSADTIDIQDGVGSNIKLNFKETEILRIVPVLNDTLNEEWISDKTRFSFDGLKNQRIGSPFSLKGGIAKINWRTAFKNFHSQLQKVLEDNPENVLFICGNTLDLETFEKLKQVAQTLGVTLVTEEYLDLDNDLLLSTKMNTTFSDILDSDLCLTVGTNTRFEASLLNVRIKKRVRMGNFVKASIGLRDDLTYSNDSIGNSIKTLLEIAEGRHAFCRQLSKAKRPFIVLGSAVKKRLDSKALSALIDKLSKYSKIVDENWLGVNFLSSQANTVGSNLVGISQRSKIKVTDENWRFIYCVGLDSFEKKSFFSADSVRNKFVVVQTPFAFSSLLKIKNGLILPATTFTEKVGTFLNVEGRIQKTSAALTSPALAQEDFKIVNALFSKFCKNQILFSSLKSNLDFNSSKDTFVKKMLIPFREETPQKIMKTPLTVLLSNFFLSNQITKNSLTMTKCSSIFKKNYLNFL